MLNKSTIVNLISLIIRQILVIISGFLVIRFLLKNLGVDGYATYVVLFSFVALLSFISSAIRITSIRNFSYAIGSNNIKYVQSLFSNCIITNIILGLFLLFFFGLVGLFVIDNYLNIITEYKPIATTVFIIILTSYVISLQSLTFEAFIKGKEKMIIFSIISISDSILKLLASVALIYLPFEYLKNYALLVMFCSILICLIYYKVSSKLDENIRFSFKFYNYELIKKNYSFLSWSLLGQSTTIFRIQGIILLFNQFFNSSIIISRSISIQIAHSINLTTENLNINFNPFLIKKFYNADLNELNKSLILLSKMSFLLTFFFALPMLVETKFILLLLFDNLTENIVLFTKLAIIDALIFSSAIPIANIARAPAKVKNYDLTIGSFQILIFILSFLSIYFGYKPSVVFIISIIGNLIIWIVRLFITSKLINFNFYFFFKKITIFIVITFSIAICLILLLKEYLIIGNMESPFVIFICFAINIILCLKFYLKEKIIFGNN